MPTAPKPRRHPITDWHAAPRRTRRTNPLAGQPGHATAGQWRVVRRVGSRVWGTLALVALLALGVWALTGTTWTVRTVRVEGTSDRDLVTRIQALPLAGCDIFRCDLARARRLAEAIPAVEHADVYRDYPNTLLVRITPRTPGLVWRVASRVAVVATDGTVLGPAPADQRTLPEVTADRFGDILAQPGARIPREYVEMATQLLHALPGLAGGTTLTYTQDAGFVAVDRAGTRIIFGTPANAVANARTADGAEPGSPDALRVGAGLEIEAARAILRRLTSEQITAKLVDVRWGDAPYYRTGS